MHSFYVWEHGSWPLSPQALASPFSIQGKCSRSPCIHTMQYASNVKWYNLFSCTFLRWNAIDLVDSCQYHRWINERAVCKLDVRKVISALCNPGVHNDIAPICTLTFWYGFNITYIEIVSSLSLFHILCSTDTIHSTTYHTWFCVIQISDWLDLKCGKLYESSEKIWLRSHLIHLFNGHSFHTIASTHIHTLQMQQKQQQSTYNMHFKRWMLNSASTSQIKCSI